MTDYSKWDAFEDSDDERIAADLRVTKKPETPAEKQRAEEAAAMAKQFMETPDPMPVGRKMDGAENPHVVSEEEAKRRNDAWCAWVNDNKEGNDAARAALEAKDPENWKHVSYAQMMKNGIGMGVAYPFDAEWFKSEPTADEIPPDIPPGFLDGCFDEIDPSTVEQIVYSGPGEWHGKLVTPAEASLLDCFAIDKAEAAEKEQLAKEKKSTSRDEADRRQRALQAAKRKADYEAASKPKDLKLAPDIKPPKPPKAPEWDGGRAVVQAAAAAAKQDVEKVPPIAQRGTASTTVPKRAKRAREDVVEADPRFVVDEASWETRDVAKLITEQLPFDSATSDEEYLEIALPDFPQNDTLVLHVSVPASVDIWAMNLCQQDHDDGASILYHFNPRRKERGGRLVENDKSEDDWGRAVKNGLPPRPSLFGLAKAEVALRIVRKGGNVDVHVTVNRLQVTSWRLRSEVKAGGLALLVPTRDDFGNRQGVTVHDAWWGALPLLPAHKPHRERQAY